MEEFSPIEPDKQHGVARRVVGQFIAAIRFVGHQLALSDQSPHEGKLRASVMPSKDMDIPDTPPLHDDTI